MPIVPKTSESIWLYPVFAFICYVSIHLEISATVAHLLQRNSLSTVAKPQSPTRPVFVLSPQSLRCSDAVDESRPALRGQTTGVLVVREPSLVATDPKCILEQSYS